MKKSLVLFLLFVPQANQRKKCCDFKDRLKNNYEEELKIAMGEQHKITIIRFKKYCIKQIGQLLKVSQLTTHVLDTSIGKPAQEYNHQT